MSQFVLSSLSVMFHQFSVLFIIVHIMSLFIRQGNTCPHLTLYLLFAFMSRVYIYVQLIALTTFIIICPHVIYSILTS